jgi:hypothetical protein
MAWQGTFLRCLRLPIFCVASLSCTACPGRKKRFLFLLYHHRYEIIYRLVLPCSSSSSRHFPKSLNNITVLALKSRLSGALFTPQVHFHLSLFPHPLHAKAHKMDQMVMTHSANELKQLKHRQCCNPERRKMSLHTQSKPPSHTPLNPLFWERSYRSSRRVLK